MSSESVQMVPRYWAEVRRDVDVALAKLASHELQCAERYRQFAENSSSLARQLESSQQKRGEQIEMLHKKIDGRVEEVNDRVEELSAGLQKAVVDSHRTQTRMLLGVLGILLAVVAFLLQQKFFA